LVGTFYSIVVTMLSCREGLVRRGAGAGPGGTLALGACAGRVGGGQRAIGFVRGRGGLRWPQRLLHRARGLYFCPRHGERPDPISGSAAMRATSYKVRGRTRAKPSGTAGPTMKKAIPNAGRTSGEPNTKVVRSHATSERANRLRHNSPLTRKLAKGDPTLKAIAYPA